MEHPIKRPTYEEHVSELFTPEDAGCMSWAIDLTSYTGIKANASKISDWIGSGRMPPPNEGRAWSQEKLQTFRNWAANAGYAEKPFVRLLPSSSQRLRRSIHELEGDDLETLKKAFNGIMNRDWDTEDPTSYFNLAGIHWLPGPTTNTYCRHHDDAYNPWHRAYLLAFEDALRSVEGCENVTLPYWDILGDELPDWMYEEPFHAYKFPHRLVSLDGTDSYEIDESSQRFPAAQIRQNIIDEAGNIEVKIGEALNANTWRDFNGWSDWPNRHEGIIRAHDNGHGTCGATIANQDVAAFDPLFWFFHCNWDRLWWKWQTNNNRRSLLAFEEVVTGDKYWLEEKPDTLLAPFDVNSAEMIDLSDWNVDYVHPANEVLNFDPIIASGQGSTSGLEAFSVSTTTRYSVRVKDIDRLNIRGSFTVQLFSGEKIVGKSRIFQPSTPQTCSNCQKHGLFSLDFIVDSEDVSAENNLRLQIVAMDKNGEPQEIPLSQIGNPTLNIRLLLDTH